MLIHVLFMISGRVFTALVTSLPFRIVLVGTVVVAFQECCSGCFLKTARKRFTKS